MSINFKLVQSGMYSAKAGGSMGSGVNANAGGAQSGGNEKETSFESKPSIWEVYEARDKDKDKNLSYAEVKADLQSWQPKTSEIPTSDSVITSVAGKFAQFKALADNIKTEINNSITASVTKTLSLATTNEINRVINTAQGIQISVGAEQVTELNPEQTRGKIEADQGVSDALGRLAGKANAEIGNAKKSFDTSFQIKNILEAAEAKARAQIEQQMKEKGIEVKDENEEPKQDVYSTKDTSKDGSLNQGEAGVGEGDFDSGQAKQKAIGILSKDPVFAKHKDLVDKYADIMVENTKSNFAAGIKSFNVNVGYDKGVELSNVAEMQSERDGIADNLIIAQLGKISRATVPEAPDAKIIADAKQEIVELGGDTDTGNDTEDAPETKKSNKFMDNLESKAGAYIKGALSQFGKDLLDKTLEFTLGSVLNLAFGAKAANVGTKMVTDAIHATPGNTDKKEGNTNKAPTKITKEQQKTKDETVKEWDTKAGSATIGFAFQDKDLTDKTASDVIEPMLAKLGFKGGELDKLKGNAALRSAVIDANPEIFDKSNGGKVYSDANINNMNFPAFSVIKKKYLTA